MKWYKTRASLKNRHCEPFEARYWDLGWQKCDVFGRNTIALPPISEISDVSSWQRSQM